MTISTTNSQPVANIGADQNVMAGDVVTLDASASTDADADLMTFRWAILARPAGSNAALSDPTAAQPTFTADVGGTYLVQLIANDGHVDSEPDTATVVARVVVPDVVGQTELDARALLVAAQLTIGTITSESSATVPAGQVISESPAAGTVVDAGSAVDVVLSLGPVPNAAPTADAGPDQTTLVGQAVTLDGSASSDDGHLQPLSYAWLSNTAVSAAGQVATVSLPAGTHVFTLTVNDGEFSATDSVTITVSASAPSPLGSAQNFAILGASIVTNIGSTRLTGDLGVSPAIAITGFPPGIVVGTIHAGDTVAAQAHADAGIANTQLKAMTCNTHLTGQDLGAVGPLAGGVYCFDTSAQLTGTLFLTGAGPWTFQVGSTLTTAANAAVVVDAGPSCSGSNVTWQVGTSATLGTGTRFVGTILAGASVTVMTGARVAGRVLALVGAVTLDSNTVSVCAPPVILANQAPVANAGPDQLVPLVSFTALDGRASTDDGQLQPLSYSWTSDTGFTAAGRLATVSLPAGTHVFTLTVSDGEFSRTDSVTITVAASAPSPLGSAQSFAVLGASIVTNIGASVLTGNLGVSPAIAITGFPPGVVVGTIHQGDPIAAQAHDDAGIANLYFKGLPCLPANNLTGQVLGVGVLSLPPGVYCFDTSAQLTGTLTLTGAGPWIFQMGSTLTTAANAEVVVADAGPACSGANVFWQVGSSATLGTGTHFAGTILALASATIGTGATVSGSVVALTAGVTLDSNAVSVCAAPVADTTAPAIQIASPVADAAYALDQVVAASFTCTDASGIASCTGTVASGAQIDTSSAGSKPFCVTAIDNAGNTSTSCVSYSVLEPPTIAVISPIEPLYELGSVLLAEYSCPGAATCTGSVVNGSALDTSTPGVKSFTITATDAAGNVTTQIVTYTVSLGTCVMPFAGIAVWLPGDGSAVEIVNDLAAIWNGTDVYGSGKVAQAFSVGGGRYLSLPFQQVGAFTLQAWVRTPNPLLPEFTGVLSTGGAGQSATSLQIELDGAGNYRLNVGDGAFSWLLGPALDVFQHVSVTFDGSTVTAYLNGQLVQSEAWTGSPGLGFHVLNLGIDREGLQPFTG